MEKISIIVPCYNEEESIPLFYEEIKKISKENKIKFELIFVNDGSKDRTLELIKDLSKDKDTYYISFSRNFGKEAAMWAGLNKATGDYVTIMDCDLQDPPSLLPKMLKILKEEEYDIVGTRRVTRSGEPPIRSFFASMFYKIINKISKVEMVDGARDFRLMKRKVVDSILELREYNRYSKGLFSFVGYKTKWLEYENISRIAGETKWSFWKLFIYAIEGIVSFSTIPLVSSIFVSLIFLLVSIILLIFILARIIAGNYALSVLIVSFLLFFIAGFILLFLGITGLYISKMYLEIKQRPIYIISETNFGGK